MSRRFTYPEAAEELRVDESWLRRHIKALPHSKKGRVVTFSAEDLDRIDAMHHHEPSVAKQVAASGSEALTMLRPLPRRGSPARIA
ncbi:helix-turn-helix domain-containing protein [Streptomyces sp. NPDC091649]|uniref:helix-turn-helix domain-containing protein n=1 Tax=Streptomyces sp. NPDC091649 TaxID=3366004 RepID=UPI00382E04B6